MNANSFGKKRFGLYDIQRTQFEWWSLPMELGSVGQRIQKHIRSGEAFGGTRHQAVSESGKVVFFAVWPFFRLSRRPYWA
jgi:hypothetical protein